MKELDKSKFWIIRDNPIIKTGVFPYLGRQISPDLNPTQIYNVLRPEDELFKQKTIDSFNMLPITIGHALLGSKDEGLTPPEEKGIDAEGISTLQTELRDSLRSNRSSLHLKVPFSVVAFLNCNLSLSQH